MRFQLLLPALIFLGSSFLPGALGAESKKKADSCPVGLSWSFAKNIPVEEDCLSICKVEAHKAHPECVGKPAILGHSEPIKGKLRLCSCLFVIADPAKNPPRTQVAKDWTAVPDSELSAD